jgi:hypothetical protein
MRSLRAGEQRDAGCFHQRLLGHALQRPYVWRFISSGVGFRELTGQIAARSAPRIFF